MADDTSSTAPTLAPSDSASQVVPQVTDKRFNRAGSKKSPKNVISKDTPPGAVQVPKGGQAKTGKSTPPQNATIQLTGWDELDLSAIKTETIPTYTVDVNPFIDLIDTEFDRIASRCPSVGKFIPFALFRYYCLQHWWFRVITLLKMNGQVLSTEEKNFLNSFTSGGEDYAIPTHVAQYLANMGNFIQGGETYYFRKISAQFTGRDSDRIVEDGWLDCGDNSTRITNGDQFWTYAQLPVPAVFATAIINEVRHNDNANPGLLTLDPLAPEADEGHEWVTTDNVAGWSNNPRLFNHSSHRSTYHNIGWTTTEIPSDIQTRFLLSPASMRWMSDRLANVKELKTYPSKQLTLSSMGSPIAAYWLETPDKFYSRDWAPYSTQAAPPGRAAAFSELALTSRFGVDPKSLTPAYNFGYRLARDKVLTGYTGSIPNIANRSNYQPWVYTRSVPDGDDQIVDPPAQFMVSMNRTWTFGSAANLNLTRFQTQVLRRDDAVSRSLLLSPT